MEDIKILEDYSYAMTTISNATEKDIRISKAIENILKRYKEAYAKANNYLYFNDSADYEVALWEVIRSLRPDLAEKWDNGEETNLKYIGE